ncbi:hypothetical protein [Eisenbergiella massiliensis]|uniref:hypothetical protein n=1 Tax=Eisenbergiella massiliensis TaxID=1720294 RepID=UPI003991D770
MIHVEFRDFDDMVGFARQLMGQVQPVGAMDTPSAAQQTEMAPEAPQAAQPLPAPAPIPVPAPAQQPIAPVPAPVLVQQPIAPVPAPAAVPTAAASYTLDDLARAAMPLMDAGRQAELQQLLQLFGVEALPALQPGQYGAFATKLREMGAQI